MATQITNYQCPACTGPLHFVGESGRLECDYCGSSFDIAEIEAFYAEKEAKAAEAAQKQEETEAAQKSGCFRSERGLGRGRGRHESLLLPIVRCGAALRRNDCSHILPILRKPVGASGTVQRHFEARFCAALQAEQGGRHQGIKETLSQKAPAAVNVLQS